MKIWNLATPVIFFLLFYFHLPARDYYWVGGSGDWSDISHWATASGGTIKYDVVPSADDNVFFDANSFTGPGQVINLNNDNLFCRNMDWTGATGNPVFQGMDTRVINIYGDLRLISDMNFSFAGEIRFRSAQPGAVIETAGHSLARSVYFDGSGGWLLTGSLEVDSMLQLFNGALTTNDQQVRAKYLFVTVQSIGALDLTGSQITLSGEPFSRVGASDYHPTVWVQNTGAFTMNGGTSRVEFTHPGATLKADRPVNFNDVSFVHPAGRTVLDLVGTSQASFNELAFAGATVVTGPFSAEHLVLSAGKFYDFAGGVTYNLQRLTADGNCVAPIYIIGRNAQGQAIFNSDGESIQVDFVNLKNMGTSGSSSFTADDSADLGNNSGWTINEKADNDLFWVGGTGAWEDPMHWSFTSGGPGGACVPSGADNVHFDENSFNGPDQSVLLGSENIYCRDMTWAGATGRPVMAGSDMFSVHILGSLTFIEEMELTFAGIFYFEAGETGKSITSANQMFGGEVFFDGVGGEWTLQDAMRVNLAVYLNNGSLVTNDQSVESFDFISSNPSMRKLFLGNTVWDLRSRDNRWPAWRMHSMNLEFDAGTSTIRFPDYPGNVEVIGENGVSFHKVVFSSNFSFISSWSNPQPHYIDSLIYQAGGAVNSDFHIGNLILTEGYTYDFNPGITLVLDHLEAIGTCQLPITLQSAVVGLPLYFKSDNDQDDLEYLLVQGIQNVGSANFIAANSVDLGHNEDWTFMERSGRTLYWVGDGGDWEDPSHWSLLSGGPGGECIPTPIDDVVFDRNSFSLFNQSINGPLLGNYFCRNLTFGTQDRLPILNIGRLYCYGDIVLEENMDLGLALLFMRGDSSHFIISAGQIFNSVQVDGLGTYTLRDSFAANNLWALNGSFYTADQPVEVVDFAIGHYALPSFVSLGNSYITITGDRLSDFHFPLRIQNSSLLTLDPGMSFIEMTGNQSGILTANGIELYDVHFSAIEGESVVRHIHSFRVGNEDPARFHRLEFNNDGLIEGYNRMDSLILAAGKSYILEAGLIQKVDKYLQVIGNNCNPIELKSTLPGNQAIITMPANGVVVGDFIQMQDQLGNGGANYFAGVHSVDIGGSNSGWEFDSRPGFEEVGFLGTDRVLCNSEALTISAYNFSPEESYLWSDGDTQAEKLVDTPGTYRVTVTFGNNCQVSDDVEVSPAVDFIADLGPDTTLCTGESLLLDASSDLTGVIYQWQDESSAPTLLADKPGSYAVSMSVSNCRVTDTVLVDYTAPPEVELGPDRELCEGEQLLLDAGSGPGLSFLWQDASPSGQFAAMASGSYSVSVSNGSCTVTDSIDLIFYPLPRVELGADTSICDGAQLFYDLTGMAENYTWQDGATSPVYSLGTAGKYSVELTNNGCRFADTIEVDIIPLPEPDLGPDRTACVGETLVLEPGVSAESYLWQDGSTVANLSINGSGTFIVEVVQNGCLGTDEVIIDFLSPPSFDLGADTSICAGEELRYDFTSLGNSFTWQDGSMAATYVITEAGRYEVTIEKDGCSASAGVEVNLRPLPEIDLGPDRTGCEGDRIPLTYSGNADFFTWQDGSADTTFVATEAGKYAVLASLEDCESEIAVQVDLAAYPEVNLGGLVEACVGELVVLDASTEGATYLWEDGSADPALEVSETGSYSVRVDYRGCVTDESVEVVFGNRPRVSLGRDTVLCAGETLEIRAQLVNYDRVIWSDGSTRERLIVGSTGNYQVEAYLGNCPATDDIFVEFQDVPALDLGPDRTICEGEVARLESNLDLGELLWSNNDVNTAINTAEAGTYWLRLDDGVCTVTDSIRVFVSTCGNLPVSAPNVFSPNGDGVNDLFRLRPDPNYEILGFDLRIFDRWGGQIFQTAELETGWDGYVSNGLAEGATYIYIAEIRYRDQNEEFVRQVSGDVLLLR